MAFKAKYSKFGVEFDAYIKIDHIEHIDETTHMVYMKVYANEDARKTEVEPIDIIPAKLKDVRGIEMNNLGFVYRHLKNKFKLDRYEDA